MVAATLTRKIFSTEAKERFQSKIQYMPGEDGCWLSSLKTRENGYTMFSIGSTKVYSHRYAWELENGPIPPGLVLDHLCHQPDRCFLGKSCLHRSCIRVSHLRLCSPGENSSRGANAAKVRCPAGHMYNEENTYHRTDRVGRNCRQCAVISTTNSRQKNLVNA